MEDTKVKKDALQAAILTLHKAIEQYHKAQALTQCSDVCQMIFNDQLELIRTTRDAMIQRFEYCVDSLWKYCKIHLEDVEKVTLEAKTPRAVFRALCTARIISEHDTEHAMEMIDARNATSHRYKEELAEQLAHKIADYYELITKIASRV